MSNVKNAVDRHTNTDLSIIPGVFTSLVQLADVNWKKKAFKEAYKVRYTQ